jgi:DNA/RNA-binding domain of Phe-tRNA-synthetase-like protein
MRKRVQNGNAIPFISPVVAIMNVNSLGAHTSVGGDDIDHVGKRLTLRFANGDECFVPLFKEGTEEHPERGEIVYVDEAGCVMCRRWNWRNCHISRIRETTRRIVMNIDGLGDDCESMVIRTRDRVAEMLQVFCDAHVTTALLCPGSPTMEFAVSGVSDV